MSMNSDPALFSGPQRSETGPYFLTSLGMFPWFVNTFLSRFLRMYLNSFISLNAKYIEEFAFARLYG